DLGIAPAHHVLTLRLPLDQSMRPAAARKPAIDEMLTRTRALPGVMAAGIGSSLPPHDPALVMTVGYLDALGVQVTAGRLFAADDVTTNESLAVLGEAALAHSQMDRSSVGKE